MTGCEYWEEQISSFLDGELTAEETQSLLEHISGCPSCRATLERYRRLFGYEEPAAAPPGFTKSVMGAITLVKAPQRTKKRPPVLRILAVAAACLLVAVTAIPLLHSMRSGRENSAPQMRKALSTGSGSAAADSAAAENSSAYAVFDAYVMADAVESGAAEPEAAMEMMLMAAPEEAAATEAADALQTEGPAPDLRIGSTAAGAARVAEAPAPVSFLVYGPTLPEALAALEFEDRGEGVLYMAEIDGDTAALLLEEGELDWEPSEDGLFHVLWYPQG